MMIKNYVIGGVAIRLDCDAAFSDGSELLPFAGENGDCDICCCFRAADSLSAPCGKVLYNSDMVKIYATDGGMIRTYAVPVTNEIAACVKESGGTFFCKYNKKFALYFSKAINMFNAIGIESLLAQKNRFVLHCSFVELNSKAILFSGPSGSGKSTRADLLVELTGAQLINGDKAVIREENGVFYACGMPVAGSSKIFVNKEFPLHKLVFLSKGSENTVKKSSGAEALSNLYRNTVINSWNADFVEKAAEFLSKLSSSVDIYLTKCDLSENSTQIIMKEINV